MATACFTGLPALTSALILDLKAALEADFFKGISVFAGIGFLHQLLGSGLVLAVVGGRTFVFLHCGLHSHFLSHVDYLFLRVLTGALILPLLGVDALPFFIFSLPAELALTSMPLLALRADISISEKEPRHG